MMLKIVLLSNERDANIHTVLPAVLFRFIVAGHAVRSRSTTVKMKVSVPFNRHKPSYGYLGGIFLIFILF